MSENTAPSGAQGSVRTAQDPVTAIDIVLEPDATMMQRAQDANDGLRRNFPKGFSLDAEHKPHISVMGGFSTPRIWTRLIRL